MADDMVPHCGVCKRRHYGEMCPDLPRPSPSTETCSTCGAKSPDENEYCSNGFHAEGPTYWPVTDEGLVDGA